MDLEDLIRIIKAVIARSKSTRYEIHISMDLLPTPYTTGTLHALIKGCNGSPIHYMGAEIGVVALVDLDTQKGYTEYVTTKHNQRSFYRTETQG